jgi:hypothetical protein
VTDPVAGAVAKIRAAFTGLSAADQTRIIYALDDLEPVLKDVLNARLKALAIRVIPVVGGLVGVGATAALDAVLDDELAKLDHAAAAASKGKHP